MREQKLHFWEHLDKSAIFTILGIILLFSSSIIVVLIAPSYVDPTWTQPSSLYQVQMYEVSDPHIYFGTTAQGSSGLQAVYHLKANYTLLAFQESEAIRIVALSRTYKIHYKIPRLPLEADVQIIAFKKTSTLR